MLKLNPSICGGEPPLHLNGLIIAFISPSFRLTFQQFQIRDSAIQTLATQYTQML